MSFSGEQLLEPSLPGDGYSVRVPRQDAGVLAGGVRPQRTSLYNQAIADAAGAATLAYNGPNPGYSFLIERVTIVGAGTAQLFVGSVNDAGLRDFTPTATADVADEASPVYVGPGQAFFIVFAGAGAGTVCKANVQVAIIRET